MASPEEWAAEKVKNIKRVVAPNPEESRFRAEMQTEDEEGRFRQKNYYNNPRSSYRPKSTPIAKARPARKISSGRVNFGRVTGR